MQKITFTALIAFLCAQIGIAQTSVKVVDSKTGEFVPYANIILGTENLISNSEGYFTLPDSDSASKIAVTCMGYVGKEMSIASLENQNFVVKLDPAVFELDEIKVTRPDPDKIMASVKQNLAKHYRNSAAAKDMLFVREASNFKPDRMTVEITKSTGFSKRGLEDANNDIKSFTKMMKSHPPKEFTDMLANYYTPAAGASKIEVVKATKLMDENKSTSFEEIQKLMSNTMLKHLDTTKYYRIKSGLIGSRDTVSMRKDFKTQKQRKKQKTHLTSTKNMLTGFLLENNFLEGSKLEFVTQPEIYEYTYEGATFMDNDNLVYVLKFTPKKNRAKYTGKLYVSESDFAVLRTDYQLAKGKTESGINLKLLLGVKMSENVNTGTILYRQNPSGEGYYMQYAAIENNQYIYLNRPLKFIELTDEDKDVVAFEIKIEGNNTSKTEFLNIARTEVPETAVANATESDFKYQVLKRYDPTIWKEYSAIEPLDEMKRFTVPE